MSSLLLLLLSFCFTLHFNGSITVFEYVSYVYYIINTNYTHIHTLKKKKRKSSLVSFMLAIRLNPVELHTCNVHKIIILYCFHLQYVIKKKNVVIERNRKLRYVKRQNVSKRKELNARSTTIIESTR